MVCSLRGHWKPEVRLRSGHHETKIVGRLSGGLGARPGDTGDATVLNATAATLFDLHLQLEIEVARLIAPVHDVVIAARMSFLRFANHYSVLDLPDAGVSVPPGERFAIE